MEPIVSMKRIGFAIFLLAFCGLAAAVQGQSGFASREVSEDDGTPVLIKHLPDWENARNRAVLTNNVADLERALGPRPVFDLIDFRGGTEAVTADYKEGKLLIVEYVTPQASVAADQAFTQRLAENKSDPPVVYRRIGNYNAFVFDATDEGRANALLDQIKYEKVVQWLGEDPKLQDRLERYLARSTAEVLLGTFFAIAGTLAATVFVGVIVGFVFFRIREQKRASMTAFSDAGGMVRLNLDQLSHDPKRLDH